jgi:hypothetical protein
VRGHEYASRSRLGRADDDATQTIEVDDYGVDSRAVESEAARACRRTRRRDLMRTSRPFQSATKASIISALILLGPATVECYCPALAPKVCSTFYRSDAVFLATVLSEASVVSKDDFIEGWRYRVRVKRPFRGTVTETVEVYTENTSSRLPLKVGRDYLLFAKIANGRLLISDDCGPASDESRLSDNIREIARLQRSKVSTIEGAVHTGFPTGTGAPGVSITISGMGRSERLTSGVNGEFRATVPPGRYQVTVDPTVAVPYDLNWIDGSNVILRPGECGQLLFIRK